MNDPYRKAGEGFPPLVSDEKRDASDIRIIEIQDLIDIDSSNLEGATVGIIKERAVGKRYTDGKWIHDAPRGLGQIKFWIILDLGDKAMRTKTAIGQSQRDKIYPRRDQFITAGVGEDQEIGDVELQEGGRALPGTFDDMMIAAEVCANLCAVSRTHEE